MKKNASALTPNDRRKQPRATPARRVSSRDVARHAGVSQTTVSFVLNGREDVSISEATRKRVLRSAARLGYLPSHLASGLLRGHTQSIGVVLQSSIYPWMVFSGIQNELAKADYVPILLSPSWSKVYSRGSKIPMGFVSDDVAAIHRLIEQQVDGLIYYSVDPTHTTDALAELTNRNIPVVLIDNDNPEAGVDFVGCDEEMVGRLAARHLLSLGRSSFGLAKYPEPFAPALRRIAGFKAELEKAGHVCRVFEVEEGYQAELARTLPELVRPPAAIFACNDVQAAVVMRAAQALGWRVPADVAVMGVGGFHLSQYTDPPITTIHRQTHENGRKAVEMLLERLNGFDGPPRRFIFQPSLEIRASTVDRASRRNAKTPLG